MPTKMNIAHFYKFKTPRNILLFIFFILAQVPSFGQIELQNAFPGLTFNNPLYLTNAGDGTNRVFVVEQIGKIKVFPNIASAVNAKTFLDITSRVASGGEMGLLGLAFHPNFETNGYFYVNYTADNPRRTIVSRFQVTSNPDSANANSEFIIISFSQPFANHNGGWIGFGPNGAELYIASGDGGSAGDPQNNGQSITTLLGKILCLDVDGGSPYAIPVSNPFYDSTNVLIKKEIYAWGFRNPWRCSYDELTGWFITGDVGQYTWEEIDLIQNGKNYGWRCYEGNHSYNLSGCNYPEYIFPIWEYNRSLGFSITGGYVYRGSGVPELNGKYIYADYVMSKVWALNYDGINPTSSELLLTAPGNITSFGLDEQMELYLVSFNGKIYKFSPTSSCLNINLNGGWNLVSVPFLTDNMASSNVFINSSSSVFGYNSGYNIADTLVNGSGYWVKYSNSQIIQICGDRITQPIPVSPGWNLIGPFDKKVNIQNISSVPPNIIISPSYGYEGGYFVEDTLKPGKGYWLKSNAAGTIQIIDNGE